MSGTSAILFDLDGTLHNRAAGVGAFSADQHLRLGLEEVRRNEYVARFVELDANGMVWKDEVYQSLVDEFSFLGNPTVDDLVNDYVCLYPRFAVEVVGARQALRSAKARGIKVGVLTNGPGALQRSLVGALGLSQHLDALVISDEVGYRKPQREIFEVALNSLGVSSSAAAMIGDSIESDVKGALSVGIHAVAFGCSSAPDGVPCVHRLDEAVEAAIHLLGASAA